MVYDYARFIRELHTFPKVYSIGKSNEGRDIFCIRIGTGRKTAVFSAAYHALEYLTGAALLDFAKRYMKMREYHNRLTLYLVPLVNPDGNEIVQRGMDPSNLNHQHLIDCVGILPFTKVWQSNALGIDINHNFNAQWQSVKDGPSPTRYGGKFPESEPETRAIVSLLRQVVPDLFIAFHSQGKEIYYDYNSMEDKKSQEYAKGLEKVTGYKACTPQGTALFGGAKDWYIKEYHKPSFTIELGEGTNPLPEDALPQMCRDVDIICTYLIEKIF